MKTSIDIIIPVYYAPELTVRCAKSVVETLANTKFDVKIILVDDSGSQLFSDLFAKLCQKEDITDKVVLVTREQNGGFIEACYTGIEYRESDYKLLLNSDTLVIGNWLDEMVKTAESDEKIAFVNPNTTHAAVIGTPMPAGSNIRLLNEYYANCQYTDDDEIDIVTCVGFCLLIKDRYIKQYGFFDRIYDKGYGEESDLHFRYVNQGLRSVLSPKAFIYHRGEASFTDRDERTKKNKEIFLKRYSKEYFRDAAEFERKTVLNQIRVDLLLNQKYEYDYIFCVDSNDYFDPDYFMACKLSNALIEKGFSCTIAVRNYVNKEDKIEDNLFREIKLDTLLQKSFTTKNIIASTSALDNGVKLSVLSSNLEHFMIFDSLNYQIKEYDFENDRVGDKVISEFAPSISLESLNTSLKKSFNVENNLSTVVIFNNDTNPKKLGKLREFLKEKSVYYIYTDTNLKFQVPKVLFSKNFAESEILKVLNTSSTLIDMRNNVNFTDLHFAFLLNNSKIFVNNITTSHLPKKFEELIFNLDDLINKFNEKIKVNCDNDELVSFSLRNLIHKFKIESSSSNLSSDNLRKLFQKFYKINARQELTTYKYFTSNENQDFSRIRYRIADKIVNTFSKIPYLYSFLKFQVKVAKKIKRMLNA